MDNATLAKLGRVLYPWKTVVKAQAAEIRRLQWERDRLRAERDDAERIIERAAIRAIGEI